MNGMTETIASMQHGTAVGLALYGIRLRQSAPQRTTRFFPTDFGLAVKEWFRALY
jgi:hypothetical protein